VETAIVKQIEKDLKKLKEQLLQDQLDWERENIKMPADAEE